VVVAGAVSMVVGAPENKLGVAVFAGAGADDPNAPLAYLVSEEAPLVCGFEPVP
jgi:hypothetical protein